MAKGNGIKDEIKAQRESLKGKGLKAHLEYFWYYYKVHLFVFLAAALFAGWFIHDSFFSGSTIFYAVAINSDISEFDERLTEDFQKTLNLDLSKDNIIIDGSLDFDSENMNANAEVQQRIITLSAANSLDLILSDRDSFGYYASIGIFSDLSEYYSAEELSSLDAEGRLYYIDLADLENNSNSGSFTFSEKDYKDMEKPCPVGVIVSDSSELKKIGAYTDSEAIAGICYGSEHTDLSKDFIEFLLTVP